jgi:hypothetical protein
MTGDRIEIALREIGERISWPETPDLTAAVTARVVRRRPRTFWRPRVLVPVAAAIAIAVVLIIPATRERVVSWLGISGVTIERTDDLDSLSTDLDLGDEIPLDAVADAVGFDPVVPESLGRPDAAFVSGPDLVTLVWSGGDRTILLTQFRGDLEPAIVKQLPGATNLELVDVAGKPAIWISGAPHAVTYFDPAGALRDSTPRLAGNTLLWEAGELTLRLEGVAVLADALDIAGSVG